VAAVDARMHAVAVVLDLMQPAMPRRRFLNKACELRLDLFGRPRCTHSMTYLPSVYSLPRGVGTFDLLLKVLKEVGPALRMLPFDEAALVRAVI
jgi:hypothetical protein